VIVNSKFSKSIQVDRDWAAVERRLERARSGHTPAG
jgi:hypothetical protein